MSLPTPGLPGTSVTTLRPATAADEEFFHRVYISTRAEELATVPWSEEQKAAFCQMQFTAQTTHYRQHYPNAQISVIERAGAPAGRLYVDRLAKEIDVVDIALLPEHRGAGTGTQLLCELQEEARATSRALSIHVEKFNPALRLYQRLGFRVREDKGVYLQMEWRAGA